MIILDFETSRYVYTIRIIRSSSGIICSRYIVYNWILSYITYFASLPLLSIISLVTLPCIWCLNRKSLSLTCNFVGRNFKYLLKLLFKFYFRFEIKMRYRMVWFASIWSNYLHIIQTFETKYIWRTSSSKVGFSHYFPCVVQHEIFSVKLC